MSGEFDKRQLEAVKAVGKAMAQYAPVRIVYRNADGVESPRTIIPEDYAHGGTCIRAFCQKRFEHRSFRIDRIVRLAETRETPKQRRLAREET